MPSFSYGAQAGVRTNTCELFTFRIASHSPLSQPGMTSGLKGTQESRGQNAVSHPFWRKCAPIPVLPNVAAVTEWVDGKSMAADTVLMRSDEDRGMGSQPAE